MDTMSRDIQRKTEPRGFCLTDRIVRILLVVLLAAELIWLSLAIAGRCNQRDLFHNGFQDLFGDFWMPRICLRDGYTPSDAYEKTGWQDDVYKVSSTDRCYPPLAMLPLRFFPATRGGALCWAAVSAMLFVLGMLVPARRSLVTLVVMPLSMPFLFNLERANTVWISAACVGVFLSWYESEVRWKRVTAALALTVAAVFKISPAMLGVLYFNTRQGVAVREMLLCIVMGTLLFFGGFLFMPDGLGGLGAMLSNAAANGNWYARVTDFGLLPFWRVIRVLMGQDCSEPWAGMMAGVRISQALGFGLLILGCIWRDRMFAIGGMLMATGNMLYYGMLYLMPVFVVWAGDRTYRATTVRCLEAIFWFVILCPLQFTIIGCPANGILSSTAVLALIALRFTAISVKARRF